MGDTATTILVEGEVFFDNSSKVAGKAASITKTFHSLSKEIRRQRCLKGRVLRLFFLLQLYEVTAKSSNYARNNLFRIGIHDCSFNKQELFAQHVVK